MTHSTQQRIEFPANREALIQRAVAEPEDCVSVGGLAHDLGLLRSARPAVPSVLGTLIEFARRGRGWSPEQLSTEAGVALADVVNIESDKDFIPPSNTVIQLARTLGYSAQRLSELAGLTPSRGAALAEAAVRFAAGAEPVSPLTAAQRQAYEEFVKVLEKPSEVR